MEWKCCGRTWSKQFIEGNPSTSELKQFCTEEWAKIPKNRCAGLIRSYKKHYLQLLMQKGVTPDTKEAKIHTFATYKYLTPKHFSQEINYKVYIFVSVVWLNSLSTLSICVKIKLCFGSYLCRNIYNFKGFTILSSNLRYIYIY